GRVPKGGLARAEAPRLYALVDRIAEALETKRVDAIFINRQFNASWSVVGIRRRSVLRLGLPLLSALTPQERVALIAHELGHGRNGDARRGFVVGSAVNGLEQLYVVLAPGGDVRTGYSHEVRMGPYVQVANALLWIVSRPVLGLLKL